MTANLPALLDGLRREHNRSPCWHYADASQPCSCGADAHNARVEEVRRKVERMQRIEKAAEMLAKDARDFEALWDTWMAVRSAHVDALRAALTGKDTP